MSWVPVRIPCRANRLPLASVAVLRRYRCTFVDWRFSRALLIRVGWARGTRISAFVDSADPGKLMFAAAGSSDTNARSLQYTGGHTLSARWAALPPFDTIRPDGGRREVQVVSAGAGQVVLDLHPLTSPKTPTP